VALGLLFMSKITLDMAGALEVIKESATVVKLADAMGWQDWCVEWAFDDCSSPTGLIISEYRDMIAQPLPKSK